MTTKNNIPAAAPSSEITNVDWVRISDAEAGEPYFGRTYVTQTYCIVRTPTGIVVTTDPDFSPGTVNTSHFTVALTYKPTAKVEGDEEPYLMTICSVHVRQYTGSVFTSHTKTLDCRIPYPSDNFWKSLTENINDEYLIEQCNVIPFGINNAYYIAVCKKFLSDYGSFIEPSDVERVFSKYGYDVHGKYAYVRAMGNATPLYIPDSGGSIPQQNVSEVTMRPVSLNLNGVGITSITRFTMKDPMGVPSASNLFSEIEPIELKETEVLSYKYIYEGLTDSTLPSGSPGISDPDYSIRAVCYEIDGNSPANGGMKVTVTGLEDTSCSVSRNFPCNLLGQRGMAVTSERFQMSEALRETVPNYKNVDEFYIIHAILNDYNLNLDRADPLQRELSYRELCTMVNSKGIKLEPNSRLVHLGTGGKWKFESVEGTFDITHVNPSHTMDNLTGLTLEEAESNLFDDIPPSIYHTGKPFRSDDFIVTFVPTPEKNVNEETPDVDEDASNKDELPVEELVLEVEWSDLLFDALGREPSSIAESEVLSYFIVWHLTTTTPGTKLRDLFFKKPLTDGSVRIGSPSTRWYGKVLQPVQRLFNEHDLSIDTLMHIMGPLHTVRAVVNAATPPSEELAKSVSLAFAEGVSDFSIDLYMKELTSVNPAFTWDDVRDILTGNPEIPKNRYVYYFESNPPMPVNVPQFIALLREFNVNLLQEVYELSAKA